MTAQGKVPSPLRYCASCLLTILLWAVWLVLVAGLGVQCYIGVVREVPVPGFILRRIESSLEKENIGVRFGAAHLDPGGQLLLENVQLRVRTFEEPVFSSRVVYVRKNIWSMLAGRPMPDDLRFEGATLQLPAIFSPSGTAEPLLRDMAGHIRFVPGEFHFDQLAFHVGSMPVTFSGVVTQPKNIHGKPLAPDALVGKFLQYGRQVALLLPQFQTADHPALSIEAAARPQGGTNLALNFTADGVHQPSALPIESGPLAVTGHWAWDGNRPHSFRLRVMVRDLTGPRETRIANIRAAIQLEPPEMEFAAISSIDAQVAAGSVEVVGERFSLPVVEGSYSTRTGLGRFATALFSRGELLSASGEANVRQKSGLVRVQGWVPPGLVTGLLTRFGPKLEPYFRFGDPVEVHATITVAPGWKFGGLASHVHGGRLDSHGVQVTSTLGRIDVDPALNFLAYDARVRAGENEARGFYWMNFHTFDYRILLSGRLRPADISGWFRSDWWSSFWKNFSFPQMPPLADVDVQGCWRDSSHTTYFGSTDATKPQVLGAEFDRGRTRIFVRPQFADVLDLAVERAGGTQRATGWFKRQGEPVGRPEGSSALDYDLTGNLDLATYQKMGGEKAAPFLAAWHFEQPPQLHVVGHTDLSDEKPASQMRFTGESRGGVQYSGFPLDGLSADGGINGDEIKLDRVDYLFAGGHGNIKASLAGPEGTRQLDFAATLQDADLIRTIRAVEDFEATRTGTTRTSMADNKIIKRANGGKLDVTFSAQGNPADVSNLHGTGTAQLKGAELAEIHLFGALSQVLSAVALNFSSLKLDAARTSFQLGDGRLHFPDIRITGPSAVIEAKGDYLFANKSLDFTAKLKPYEESHNPLTAVASMVITPFTSIFELKLTGPLAKPSWSIVLGQGPKLEPPAAATAPDPARKPVPAPAPADTGGKPGTAR